MKPDKFTHKLQEALTEAQMLAIQSNHTLLEPIHVLKALLEQQGGIIASIITQAGGNLKILSTAIDSGLKVPEDVGLLGLNDMEMARWENISLTTIHQPIRQIVTSSIELMVAMLNEPDRYPEARIFPCSIVERDTLRPALAN